MNHGTVRSTGGEVRPSSPWNTCRGAIAVVLVTFCLLSISCGPRGAIPDPQNELPFGVVDVPEDGSAVAARLSMHGWALDDGRIGAVRVFVDNRFRTTARLGLPRPDVADAYPQYARGRQGHGWAVEVDLSDRAGTRELLVQAVDDHGATRDIGSIRVVVGAQ